MLRRSAPRPIPRAIRLREPGRTRILAFGGFQVVTPVLLHGLEPVGGDQRLEAFPELAVVRDTAVGFGPIVCKQADPSRRLGTLCSCLSVTVSLLCPCGGRVVIR